MFVKKSKKILLCSSLSILSYGLLTNKGFASAPVAQQNIATSTTDSSSIVDSGSNPLNDNVTTIPDGENYLESVRGVVKDYNHNESLSLFSSASSVQSPASVKASTMCVQKVPAGFYASDSLDSKQNGMVSTSRAALYLPMFQLNQGAKFILNIPEQTDGTGKIQNYIGLVLLRHGDGSAYGDIICFAQYLSPQQRDDRNAASSPSQNVASGQAGTVSSAPVSPSVATPAASA